MSEQQSFNSQPAMSIGSNVTETVNALKKEFNQLAVEDVPTVLKSLTSYVEGEVKGHPYRTLASALTIGYGLASLNGGDLKTAAVRLTKMISLRALSNIDESKFLGDSSSATKH